MTLEATNTFAVLIGRARAALGEAHSRAAADSRAMLNAACAASRAAGFIEAVTLSDPAAARDMVEQFESFVDDAHRSLAGGSAG